MEKEGKETPAKAKRLDTRGDHTFVKGTGLAGTICGSHVGVWT